MPKEKVKAQAYIFQASENSQANANDWNEFLEKDIITYSLKGSHESIFEVENLKNNASIFNEIIMRWSNLK